MSLCFLCFFIFFFNDTATTEIYTLSLHDALPISWPSTTPSSGWPARTRPRPRRSEEHTSELQSRSDLVCRLLLEKKKQKKPNHPHHPTRNADLIIQRADSVLLGFRIE